MFHQLFRAEIARYLEYSFGSGTAGHGTMIAGAGPSFVDRTMLFASAAVVSDLWNRCAQQFTASLTPASYFFKVDWDGPAPEQITLYCRFHAPVSPDALQDAIARSALPAWSTVSPHELASIVGESSPVIIALRARLGGGLQSAVYYRIRARRAEFFTRQLPALLDRLNLPSSTGEAMRECLAPLLGFWFPPMLGIDSPMPGASAVLKVDIAGVCLSEALAFLRRMKESPARLSQLAATGRSLSLEVLNYVGTKFTNAGYRGWKLYMPVHPMDGLLAPLPKLRLAGGEHSMAHRNMLPW